VHVLARNLGVRMDSESETVWTCDSDAMRVESNVDWVDPLRFFNCGVDDSSENYRDDDDDDDDPLRGQIISESDDSN